MKQFFIIITLSFFVGFNSFSQSSLSSKSKKAIELYYEADNYKVRGQYTQAIDLLEQAINKDKEFHEAYFLLGVIYKAKGDLIKAEQALLKVTEFNKGNNGPSFFELGELYLKKNDYQKSLDYINKYLAYNPRNRARVEEANRMIGNAEFALANAATATEFNPHPLSDTVNAFAMQYFPVVSVDQNTIIYTRRLGTTMDFDEDLVISTKNESGSFGEPRSISDNINSEFNEGTCTLSADGRTLIFTSCYGRQGFGSCDLYISSKNGADWSIPKNMGGIINSSAWDSQPSLSADGRRLFFISNRGGGVGSRDIWVTDKDDKNNWSKPKNLGRGVNTVADEVSPFIHPNNKTLYYATNGLPGFGGFDIYYTSQEEDGGWSQPVNLGAPVNSGEDQVSLFITSDGEKGYYSNEDNKSKNRNGIIYEFTVPKAQQVKFKTSYIYGIIRDELSLIPLKAKLELYDLRKDQRVALVESDSITGDYLMVLTEGTEYALYIESKGYLFQSYSFTYQLGEKTEPVMKDIYLSPIKSGAITKLNNLFFATDKYELEEKSKTELKKVINFLINNPQMTIQISGHTDNVGYESYNLELSKRRAASVYQYLADNGVNKIRMTYLGSGSTQPTASNDTEMGRQLNRRIEFKIVKFE